MKVEPCGYPADMFFADVKAIQQLMKTTTSTESLSLPEAMEKEIKNAEGLLAMYESIPTGGLGAAAIRVTIQEARDAMAKNDPVEMLVAYQILKTLE